MELTVREAAALLGRSPRAVRAQLVRGDLKGVKRGGRWRVERRHLPLTEVQREALQAKADSVRQAVEEALPSRLARTHAQKSRSLADLDAFRNGARLLAELRADDGEVLSEVSRRRVIRQLEGALLALAEAAQHFERELKLEAIHRARSRLARATAILLLEAGIPPGEPVFGWVAALEAEIIPAVAGFARWAGKLRGGGR